MLARVTQPTTKGANPAQCGTVVNTMGFCNGPIVNLDSA